MRDEFERYRDDRSTNRKSRLTELHDRLGQFTFFDPACGCGNFLILAYRELRLLELDILDALYPKDSNGYRVGLLDVEHLSKIDVDQFYGIKINEFPVRVAETAMWLVDHQMNMKLGDMFGKAFARLPLQKIAKIHHGNALITDWNDVIAAEKCCFVLGNPPFIGSKYMSKQQSIEIKSLMPTLRGIGNLDYVCGWYLIASDFIKSTQCKVAFVSTNSISQGEQVGVLWKYLIEQKGISIHFAHRTFKWTIDEQKAKGMNIAAVYCIIAGIANFKTDSAYLYEYETVKSDPIKIKAKNINPYLTDRETFFIEKQSKPICDVPEIKFGNQPIDGGFLILSGDERLDALKSEPEIEKFIKPFLGARELINGLKRYCLWLKDASPSELSKSKFIKERIELVKRFRLESNREATRELAQTPANFAFVSHPKTKYIAVPRVSSETREYIPLVLYDSNTIVSDSCLVIPNATFYHLGILTSKMHMDWMRIVAGRLKSDYRYSNTIVYNNFPWPDVTKTQEKDIADKAQAVLDARDNHKGATLAELYNPTLMPVDLRKAHNALDKAVDKAYRKKPFESELERIQFLFERYQELTEPLTAEISKKPKRTQKKKG